jgi:hypothetical protein
MLFLLRQRYSQKTERDTKLYTRKMSYSLLRGLCVEARDEYANHSECLFKIQNNI